MRRAEHLRSARLDILQAIAFEESLALWHLANRLTKQLPWWQRLIRHVFLVLGLAFVALGFIGIFLPVLPTTPFLILAAACFARSSPRLENWLLWHPHFGPLLRAWRERGAIPRKAKLMALAGTSIGFLAFWAGSKPGPLLTAGVALLMLSGLAYVFSRPSI